MMKRIALLSVLFCALLSLPTVALAAPSAVLTWNEASTAVVTGFNVYRSTVSGGPYTKIGATASGTLTYTDATLSIGTQYFYVVTAVNGTSESVYSNQASAVVLVAPTAPTGLTIVVK